ncbi:unnamed protein product [Orchesella dallaii]|uniref:Uncharacterized protein n=1 Tax=Orchesella dallaii TaxID=48710 RepID=A0ABP1RGQ9_9HEXA
MKSIIDTASWVQTQNLLITHYRYSTVEFLWEENTSVAASTWERCITLQCILLSFTSFWVEHNLLELPIKNYQNILDKLVWINLRRHNAIAVTPQKFSSHNLLLISDTTFPSKGGRNRELQTAISTREVLRHNIPLVVPNVIVFASQSPFEYIKYNDSAFFIEQATTSTILIFARNNSVSIGSFFNEILNSKFDNSRSSWMVKISFTTLPTASVSSFNNLISFWEKLYTSFQFGGNEPIENPDFCGSSYKSTLSLYEDLSCETFKTYIDWTNCTDFKTCFNFYSFRLSITDAVTIEYPAQAIPFGQEEVHFGFQVLFPKVNLFDANLTAFLTPMTIDVWLYTFLSIFTISIWLVWLEGGLLRKILYWQFTVLFEQDEGYRFLKGGFWAKTIVIGWILSAILLRNFYSSSLYSMIAAEREPNDYPHTLQELLNDKDYQFLVPYDVSDEIWLIMFSFQAAEKSGQKLHLALHVARLYANIALNAYMFLVDNIEVLQNISLGKYARTHKHMYLGSKNSKLLGTDFGEYRTKAVDRKFVRFGVVCIRDCQANWNVPLMKQTWLHHMVPKQMPFLNMVKVWVINPPQYATFSFRKFLGWFVQSGLYEHSTKGSRMLSTLKIWQSINFRDSVGSMSNGSLFSYIFMTKRKRMFDNEEEPTQLSAFSGTFILTGVMLTVAVVILIYETLKPIMHII